LSISISNSGCAYKLRNKQTIYTASAYSQLPRNPRNGDALARTPRLKFESTRYAAHDRLDTSYNTNETLRTRARFFHLADCYTVVSTVEETQLTKGTFRRSGDVFLRISAGMSRPVTELGARRIAVSAGLDDLRSEII